MNKDLITHLNQIKNILNEEKSKFNLLEAYIGLDTCIKLNTTGGFKINYPWSYDMTYGESDHIQKSIESRVKEYLKEHEIEYPVYFKSNIGVSGYTQSIKIYFKVEVSL